MKVSIVKNISELSRIKKYLDEVILQFPDELNISNISEYVEKLNQNAEIYFLVNKNEDIGMCAIYSNDYENKIIYISSISIKKEYLSKGLGQVLLDYIFTLRNNYNMKYIKLEVKKNNIKAINFYKKNGFQIITEREDTYLMINKVK